MIQVIHTPLGEPLGQIISEIPHEKAHFTKPLRELEETQRILVSFNSRPLSAPIECKKLIPEASVHPGSSISQISVKYYKKPNQSPPQKKSPEHANLSSSPKAKYSNLKPRLNKSPSKSVPRPLLKPKEVPNKEKANKISTTKPLINKPKNPNENQKTVKPEKPKEPPQPKKEEKPKADPEKLKLILKESISKHKEQKIKEQELEMIEEEKMKQKQKEIRDFSEEAKEKLEKAKKVPFKPKIAWGADQRKFQEQDEKFREEAKKENEKKREAREKVRQEGRARIGLKELFEAKPDLEEKIRNKSKGNEEKTAKKPPKQPNEEIQAYMAEQKRLRKLRLEEEKKRKEEENRLRIAKLKELDELSRSRANVSKRSDSNPDLERRMRIIRKAKSAARRMRNGGSADYSYEEEKIEKNSEEPSEIMQQRFTDEDIYKSENLWEKKKNEVEKYSEPDRDRENIDENVAEKDSDESERYEDEYTSEEKFSVEEKVPVKDENSEINFSRDLKIQKDNLPGNSKEIGPSYQEYIINPKAIDDLKSKNQEDELKFMKKELEFFKSEQISISQAVSNRRNLQNENDFSKRKETLRNQLANLQTRLAKIVKQKNQTPVKDETKIEDDLDVKFTEFPGILNAKNWYAEAQEFDEFIQFKAARKIQALVRGYLARKDFQKKKLGIKSQKEINTDIHSILNKYYPEAYIPESSIISSYVPESMSYPATSINPTLSSNLKSISLKPEPDPIKIIEEPAEKSQLKLQNLLRNDFTDNDEYNLVNILAKELYSVEKIEEKELDIVEEPEASIHTSEEQYSSEFESEEEIKSKISEEEPARSSRIKFSDDYRLSSSKFGITESIYEEENSDIPESIYESKASKKGLISSFKGSKSEISESIYESKGVSSRRFEDSGKKYTSSSIPEDITESKGISSRRVDSLGESSKRFASSISEDIIESKKSLTSDIPEDIYESKKTLNSYISEEISDSSPTPAKSKLKQSHSSDHYSEDFESVSSSHEALVKRFESPQNIQETYEDDFESASKTELESSLKNDFQKKIEEIPAPGKFSAKQLQDQLISQIEAFDRAKNRELEAEMMVKAHRQWMEEKKKEEMMMIMKAQELYIEELKKSKQEDHDKFQQLAQFIANQQKESFSDLAAVIRQALINVPRPRTPSKKSDTSEIDYVEERKSPLRPDDYARTEYSEDFESYSDSSKQYGLKNSGRIQSPDYSKKYIEQQIKEEADRSRFSSSSSLTRSLSPQIKITPRDKLKNSDDFRASSSSIPEDIDMMASYKSSDFIEEYAALKNYASSHEVSALSKSIETEISKKEESIDESLPQYSDDFDSLSKSKQTLNEYSSDFESASQSIHPTMSSRVLTQSIKEESPGHSETDKSKEESDIDKSKDESESEKSKEESIEEFIDNYEDDFESESSSVLKSSRDKVESSSSGAKSSSVVPEESSESKKSSSVEEKVLEESNENKQSIIGESIEELSEDIQSYEYSHKFEEDKSKEEQEEEEEEMSSKESEDLENQADIITNEIFASIFEEVLENLPGFNVDELVDSLFQRVLSEALESLPVSESSIPISSPQAIPAVNTDTNSVLGYTSIILGSAHNFTLNPFTKDSIETLAMLRESNYIDHALMNPEQLLPIDLYMQLEEEKQDDDSDNAKILAQQIHNKMIFDAVNEALNRLRPHGRKGSPLPWSNVARINKTVAVGDLKNQVEGLVNSWAEIKYGQKQAGEQAVLNETEEKKKGSSADKDNSEKLLNSVIADEAEEWVDYEDAETKVKIELEQFIFDQLIEETEYILSSM
ncbi:unnamed protein product [Blepharisma stoltei]|uniref:DUF4378 domain-containing protein n=1 Tax=Blepharisma stoltei TaxID=1481888 RepID=A0AAU9IG80_9CILI|nr:unnamed protein product [Blepharisma stoltei]